MRLISIYSRRFLAHFLRLLAYNSLRISWAVQPKEAGRTPFNRQVRPLALRFHSQMRPTLFKGHFDGRAFDEVCHDLSSALRWIGRGVGFGFPLALRLTRDHPANGPRIEPRGIPQRRARRHLHLALASAIPGDAKRFPGRLGVMQHRAQLRQPLAHHRWTTLLMWLGWRWWRKQPCIQEQRGNQTHALFDARQAQFD